MSNETESKNDYTYKAAEFISKLTERIGNKPIPACPICGNRQFSTVDQFATLAACSQFNNLAKSDITPCAMVICTNCGHIDYFALGMLGLLPKSLEPRATSSDKTSNPSVEQQPTVCSTGGKSE